MRKYITCLFFIGTAMANVGASELLCGNAKNTVEEAQCLSAELEKADKIQADYLAVAKERIAKADLGKPQLDIAQTAWRQYRTTHCGDVYTYWAAGTYRYRAELECEIELTRSRTHDIWKTYLTYLDSTPPVRPEP